MCYVSRIFDGNMVINAFVMKVSSYMWHEVGYMVGGKTTARRKYGRDDAYKKIIDKKYSILKRHF